MTDRPPRQSESGLLGRILYATALPWSGDFVFIVVALAIPLWFAGNLFAKDGDVGRHIRVGSDILQGGSLFFLDRYSFYLHLCDRPLIDSRGLE